MSRCSWRAVGGAAQVAAVAAAAPVDGAPVVVRTEAATVAAARVPRSRGNTAKRISEETVDGSKKETFRKKPKCTFADFFSVPSAGV